GQSHRPPRLPAVPPTGTPSPPIRHFSGQPGDPVPRLRPGCDGWFDQTTPFQPPHSPDCTMDKWSTAELRTADPATRAEADVRAVLSALQGLSGPAEVEVQPRFA